ncbi:MAG: hypothetical protein FJ291_28060 [Planctomycetes bacterium]|nr:hypothetical protein [Planctomycetota bacterium]
MTGKQCMFSAHPCEEADKKISGENLSVFVIIPFSPNLETFYLWSLKPLLIRGYGLKEERVQRADEVRDIGYIVCEKICRKIQESDLILAEVSTRNPNVFYELGLAYGLQRPIVFLRDRGCQTNILQDARFRQSLNLSETSQVLVYPGVGKLELDIDGHRLERFVFRPPVLQRKQRKLEIRFLSVDRPSASGEEHPEPAEYRDAEAVERYLRIAGHLLTTGSAEPTRRQDIGICLEDVLKGAVGVAMAEIRLDIEKDGARYRNEAWAGIVAKTQDWGTFSSVLTTKVDGKGSFQEISESLESSFCTIIDITDNDPIACFWLGYCHARDLSVIPISKAGPARVGPHRDSNLAFDIRALWYAEYEEAKPYEFKAKAAEIMVRLLERDLPDRQRRAFWDRFQPQRKLKVLTGAIHSPALNREMVGDWDVRAISELYSYLPLVREAMSIELATPLYSPEEAFRRELEAARKQAEQESATLNEARVMGEVLKVFRDGVEAHLGGSDVIVIASPDVNPVTEYLLHKVYRVRGPNGAEVQPFEECERAEFDGYVAVKRFATDPESSRPLAVDQATIHSFPRRFYLRRDAPSGQKPDRGFYVHTDGVLLERDELLRLYRSQDECRDPFELLGHLVVARYPSDDSGSLLALQR